MKTVAHCNLHSKTTEANWFISMGEIIGFLTSPLHKIALFRQKIIQGKVSLKYLRTPYSFTSHFGRVGYYICEISILWHVIEEEAIQRISHRAHMWDATLPPTMCSNIHSKGWFLFARCTEKFAPVIGQQTNKRFGSQNDWIPTPRKVIEVDTVCYFVKCPWVY